MFPHLPGWLGHRTGMLVQLSEADLRVGISYQFPRTMQVDVYTFSKKYGDYVFGHNHSDYVPTLSQLFKGIIMVVLIEYSTHSLLPSCRRSVSSFHGWPPSPPSRSTRSPEVGISRMSGGSINRVPRKWHSGCFKLLTPALNLEAKWWQQVRWRHVLVINEIVPAPISRGCRGKAKRK